MPSDEHFALADILVEAGPGVKNLPATREGRPERTATAECGGSSPAKLSQRGVPEPDAPVAEGFACAAVQGSAGQTRLVGWVFTFPAAAYSLVLMPDLLAQAA